MKKKKLSHRQSSVISKYATPVLFVLIFGSIGVAYLAFSSAAVVDEPIGIADYCKLENNRTAIYGWAHDKNAGTGALPNVQLKIGSATYTVSTNVNDYRKNAIDDFLELFGIQTANQYGFKLSLGGLYKGTNPTISGTAKNVGVGIDKPLLINTDANIAGVSGESYFSGNKIPNACLATAPVSIPSPTNPAPAPKPKPTPAPVQATPGTPTSPTTSTQEPEANQAGQSTTVEFRFTNDGETASSISGAIQGISIVSETDENGVLRFDDIATGTYVLSFTDQVSSYLYDFTVSQEEGEPHTFTVELSELVAVSGEPEISTDQPVVDVAETSSSRWPTILTVLLLGGITFGVAFILRRRSRSSTSSSYDYNSIPLTSYETPAPSPNSHQPTAEELQNNVGVSLKEMVIESMQEEAERKHPKQ